MQKGKDSSKKEDKKSKLQQSRSRHKGLIIGIRVKFQQKTVCRDT